MTSMIAVSSNDHGDCGDFQSTQIQTVQFDLMTFPRTITVTGLGTDGGLSVAFTYVGVETDPTTPGFVSFVFSDGYTNDGLLTMEESSCMAGRLSASSPRNT